MFWAGIWKILEFSFWKFSFFGWKFSIYLNRRVFVLVFRPTTVQIILLRDRVYQPISVYLLLTLDRTYSCWKNAKTVPCKMQFVSNCYDTAILYHIISRSYNCFFFFFFFFFFLRDMRNENPDYLQITYQRVVNNCPQLRSVFLVPKILFFFSVYFLSILIPSKRNLVLPSRKHVYIILTHLNPTFIQ